MRTIHLGEISVRRRRLFDLCNQNGLVVINTGDHTFYRGKTSRPLDLTFVSPQLLPAAHWHVDVEAHGSDHVPTYICLDGVSGCHRRREVSCINWGMYAAAIDESEPSLTSYENLMQDETCSEFLYQSSIAAKTALCG